MKQDMPPGIVSRPPGSVGARALMSPRALASPFFRTLTDVCERNGVHLTGVNVLRQRRVLPGARNLITWGMHVPRAEYDKDDRNVLWMENGLLGQRNVQIDHRGLWGDASLVVEGTNRADFDDTEDDALSELVRKEFGWDDQYGCDRDGPVLVALSTPADATTNWYYPAGVDAEDKTVHFVRLLAEVMDIDRPVIIRPHPWTRNHWKRVKSGLRRYHWRDSWTVDGTTPVYEMLPRCSGLVTISSAMATEAMCLSMPVATYGSGCWSGSGAVIDCRHDHRAVSGLFRDPADRDAQRRYLCALARAQVSPSATVEELERHPSLRKWLDRCRLSATSK